MQFIAQGEVRRVTHREGTSKAGNAYSMDAVRILTDSIDVCEVTIFGGSFPVPALGSFVSYDVEVEVFNGNLSANVVNVRDTVQTAYVGLAATIAPAPEVAAKK